MSVLLVKIPSPVNPDINHKEAIDFVPGQSLAFYVDSRIPSIDPSIEWVVSVNGQVVAGDHTAVAVQDNDKIAICPKAGFTAAAAVATAVTAAATSVVSFSSLAALASYSVGAAALYAGTFLATSFVIGYGMSMLASALAPDMPDMSGTAEDPTYEWEALRPSENEGVRIPYVYGTNRVGGHVITRFVLPEEDNTEKLYVLNAVCDDEVDSISDIQINDQPASFFDGCDAGARLGTLSDDLIPGFDELITHNGVLAKVTRDTPRTYQTQGVCEKLRIILSVPSGLYWVNDEGRPSHRTINYSVEYRPVGGEWVTHVTRDWTEATTSAVRRVETIDDLPQAQHEVRVTRNTADPTIPSRDRSELHFDSLQEIVKESLIYPGLAKYYVKITATDQLSGMAPSMSCLVTKSTVPVYDPDTGTWVPVSAANPAWICYDLLMKARVPKERMLYYEFAEWADYCTNKGIVCNTVVTSGNFWEQIQRIARIGRAAVLRRNTFYGVFVDKPLIGGAHHLFTMGNIVEDSFNIQYLPQKDRATAVELEYTDPDRDYTRQVVTVYSSEYITGDDAEQKASVSFLAALPQEQVIREGVFRINSNRYLVRAVVLDAFVDAFACTVGDVFEFKHEILDFSDANAGGRIQAAGNYDLPAGPYVTLDRPVQLTALGTYKIKVRLADDSFAEKTVDNTRIADFSQAVTTLPLTQPWVDIPQSGDLYASGEADTYIKQYRITAVARKDENIRTITGLEYIPEIYTDGDGYVIEEPPWENQKQAAVRVLVTEFLAYSKTGGYQSNLNVAWHKAVSASPGSWTVWLKDLSSILPPVTAGSSIETNFVITAGLVVGRTYRVYVTVDGEGFAETASNYADVTILGKLSPPADVLNFTASWVPIRRVVELVWTMIDDIDFDFFEIRLGGTWADAEMVARSTNTRLSLFVDEGVSETRAYSIKAVDTSGIYSLNEAVAIVDIDTGDCGLPTPGGLTLTSMSTTTPSGKQVVLLTASWNADAELSPEFHHYELQLENVSTGMLTGHSTTSRQYQWEVLPATVYGVSVRAVDTSGNRTDWVAQVQHETAVDDDPPAAPEWDTIMPAVPGFKVVGLKWQAVADYDLSHYVVERATDAAFTQNVTSLGEIRATFYADSNGLDVAEPYYYRLKAVDTSGNESTYSPVESATTLRVGTTDIAYNAIIADHILVSNLAAIKANLGTITAGRLQNSANTTYFDLETNRMTLGDSLSFDPVNGLSIAGDITITNGVGFGNLSDRPTTLYQLNSSEGNKLSGVEAGADVTGDHIAYDTSRVSDTSALAVKNNAAAGATFTEWDAGAMAYLEDLAGEDISASLAGGYTLISGGKINTSIIQVGTAQILNAAITNAKIGNLAVSAAKIGNSAITYAKIGHAEVGTLTIAGDAITQRVVASGSNPTLSITTNGGDVLVQWSAETSYSSNTLGSLPAVPQVSLSHNSSTSYLERTRGQWDSISDDRTYYKCYLTLTGMFLKKSLSAGTHTFKMVQNNTAYFDGVVVTAIEVKR